MRRARVRALLPNASDYLTAFRLLGVPAVLIIVLLGALGFASNVLLALAEKSLLRWQRP